MRVITQQKLGGPEVLTIVDAPEPQPLPTEVLVRVKAIGLNPLEARLRAGEFPLIGKPAVHPRLGHQRRGRRGAADMAVQARRRGVRNAAIPPGG